MKLPADKITLDTFSEHNRDRHIGNSLYRICRNEDTGKWYIHERYNDGTYWGISNGYFSESLEDVINKINSFTVEKEVINE
jgi:hypothetical protein